MLTWTKSCAMLGLVMTVACGSSDTPAGGGGNAGGGTEAGAGGAAGSGNEAGGSAGSSSDTGGSAGGVGQDSGAMCPARPPIVGSPCSPPAMCLYGGGICCGGGYRCSTTGQWELIMAACACNQAPDGGITPTIDASSSSDASGRTCAQETTAASCDARNDCHSVYYDPRACGCEALGCCTRFQRCAAGDKANCKDVAMCLAPTPYCEGPYVISYANACYEGCVKATDCAP